MDKLCSKNGVDDSWNQEGFEDKLGQKWFDRILEYNNEIIGVDLEEFREKHGKIYYSSKTRNALRTLDQFLKNMLTPIWIRDVPYNIKGVCSEREFDRHINNVKIEFKP